VPPGRDREGGRIQKAFLQTLFLSNLQQARPACLGSRSVDQEAIVGDATLVDGAELRLSAKPTYAGHCSPFE
jgi:hypothetical protein